MFFRSSHQPPHSHRWGITATPFLPVRQDFHPKRNQARQKLATLPKNRFKDLASDVYFELKRRWPEFEEAAVEVGGEGETHILKEGKSDRVLTNWFGGTTTRPNRLDIMRNIHPHPHRRRHQSPNDSSLDPHVDLLKYLAYPTLNPIKRHSAFPPVRTVR
jgi:hypothetical protein